MVDVAPTPAAGAPVSGSSTVSGNNSSNQPDNTAAQTDSQSIESDYLSDDEFKKLSKRKVRHKIDGKDVEATFEDTIKGYSHTRAANERMEAAANERKAVAKERLDLETQLAKLKNPKEARAILNKYLGEEGFSQMAHETVAEALRRESMTPEELQAEQDSRELEEYRGKTKAEKEAAAKTEHQTKVNHFTETLANDLAEFGKTLPTRPQPHELESLLGVMLNAMDQGVDIPIQDAYRYVQKQESGRFERYLANVDIAQLPKDFIEKVRQHSVADLPNFRTAAKAPAETSGQPEEKVGASGFFKKMRK